MTLSVYGGFAPNAKSGVVWNIANLKGLVKKYISARFFLSIGDLRRSPKMWTSRFWRCIFRLKRETNWYVLMIYLDFRATVIFSTLPKIVGNTIYRLGQSVYREFLNNDEFLVWGILAVHCKKREKSSENKIWFVPIIRLAIRLVIWLVIWIVLRPVIWVVIWPLTSHTIKQLVIWPVMHTTI